MGRVAGLRDCAGPEGGPWPPPGSLMYGDVPFVHVALLATDPVGSATSDSYEERLNTGCARWRRGIEARCTHPLAFIGCGSRRAPARPRRRRTGVAPRAGRAWSARASRRPRQAVLARVDGRSERCGGVATDAHPRAGPRSMVAPTPWPTSLRCARPATPSNTAVADQAAALHWIGAVEVVATALAAVRRTRKRRGFELRSVGNSRPLGPCLCAALTRPSRAALPLVVQGSSTRPGRVAVAFRPRRVG
jgi:hypothetical protein